MTLAGAPLFWFLIISVSLSASMMTKYDHLQISEDGRIDK